MDSKMSEESVIWATPAIFGTGAQGVSEKRYPYFINSLRGDSRLILKSSSDVQVNPLFIISKIKFA